MFPCAAVAWVRTIDEFRKLAPALDALAARVDYATVFSTSAWLIPAAEAETSRRLEVATLVREGKLIGMLPLTCGWERHEGGVVRTARVLGYPMTDRFTLLWEPDATDGPEMLLDAALLLPVDLVWLPECVDGAETATVIRRWCNKLGAPLISRLASQARIAELTADSSDDLERSYSSKHRTNVRRSRRLLRELGELSFEALRPSCREVDATIARLKTVEDAAWQGLQRTGIFSTPSRTRLMRGVFLALARERALHVEVLRIDERDLMYVLGFSYEERLYWYNTAFIEGSVRGSAFIVLLHEFMLELRRAGIRIIDSSRNRPFVENAMDRLRHEEIEHRHFLIFRKTPLAKLHRLALLYARPRYRMARAVVTRQRAPAPALSWQDESAAAQTP